MKLKSRKLWITALVPILGLIAKAIGVELSDAAITAVAVIVSSYLIGQSWVDGKNGTPK